MASEATTFLWENLPTVLDSKGRLTIPSKWRIPGGQHLPGSAKPRRVCYGLSAKNGGETRGKSSRSESFRCSCSGIINGIIRKSTFLWLRQAGPDKSERQINRARRNKGEGRARGKFSAFAIWSETRYAKRPSGDQRNIFDAMRELGL